MTGPASQPEVSVVLPTRDRTDLLKRALRCALYQREVDVEVIVVDDGSEVEVRGALEAVADERIRVLRNEQPTGVSAARNRAMAQVRGAWVAFLDDDDLWSPDKLRLQLEALRRQRCRWGYAGDVTVDEQLDILAGSPPPAPAEVMESLRRYNAVPAGASNVLVSADLLERVGGFDEGLHHSEDWDMWLRLAREGPPACARAPLVACTEHRAATSRSVREMLSSIEVIAQRHGLQIDRVRHLRWAAWLSLLAGRRWSAAAYYARAVALGDAASLARGALALARPGFARRLRSRHRAEHLHWEEQGRSWIAAVVAQEPDAVG